MKNDPHIMITIGLPDAWQRARDIISRHWRALLVVWFLTSLISSLAYVALYPPWAEADSVTVGSFRHAVYVVTTSLVGAAGFVFVVLLTRAETGPARGRAAGDSFAVHGKDESTEGGSPGTDDTLTGRVVANGEQWDYGALLDESVQRLARYVGTAVLCLLRVLLWGLMALPIVMLAGLLGVGGSGIGGILLSLPATILMILAFMRFGWGLFFTVLNDESALYAMYHGQSLYLNNRGAAWAMALIAFLVPSVLPFLDAHDAGGLARYLHPAAYLASAWTYITTVFVAVVLLNTTAGDADADGFNPDAD